MRIWASLALCITLWSISTLAHNCNITEAGKPYYGFSVDCSNLKLSSVPSDLPYENVTKLDFSGNALSKLENGLFQDFVDLKILNLNANQYDTYSKGAFEGLSELEELSMNSNWMTDMSHPLCNDMPKLKNFSAIYESVGVLSDKVFQDCNELVVVYMAVSGLTDIGQAFSNLAKLKGLSLASNENLKIADDDSFENSPQLSVLDMSDVGSATSERLDHLPKPIRAISSLKQLRLNKGIFTTFSKDDTAFFDGLEKLYGANNPYTCTCDTTDFITWMQSATNIMDKEQFDCSSHCDNCPPSFLMIDYNVDTCGGTKVVVHGKLVLIGLIIGAVLVAGIIVTVLVVMKIKRLGCFRIKYGRM